MESEYLKGESTRPSHAEAARTLAAVAREGVLATLEEGGHPYASIVEVMADDEGAMVLFLSDLAAHTNNLKGDARASVVVADSGGIDGAGAGVLARGRATLQGELVVVEDGRDRFGEAWVARHPGAANYIGFTDFNFYRMEVERIRYIAGFGRMGWVTAATYREARPDPLREMAGDVIDHMNEDHAHNLVDYLHAYTAAHWADEATMVGLDQYGFDIVGTAGERSETFRLTFVEPRDTREQIHEVMVRLAREAKG